jgi:hypothetical protein
MPVPGQTKTERVRNLMGLFKRELGAARRDVDQGADHQRTAIAGIEPSPMAHFLSRLSAHCESHNLTSINVEHIPVTAIAPLSLEGGCCENASQIGSF